MLFKNKTCEKCGVYYDVALEECPSCKTRDKNFEKYGIPKNLFWLSYWQQIAIFLIGFSYGGLTFFTILFNSLLTSSGLKENLKIILLNGLSYSAVVLLIIVVCIPNFKKLIDQFKNKNSYLTGLIFAGFLLIASLLWGALTMVLGANVNNNQQGINKVLGDFPLLSILFLGIIGPISEEFTYRVGVFTFGRRLNRVAAYVISMTIFALIHISFVNIDLKNELLSIPDYLISGFLLALAYEKGGLASSITAHSTYNIAAMLLILLR